MKFFQVDPLASISGKKTSLSNLQNKDEETDYDLNLIYFVRTTSCNQRTKYIAIPRTNACT
jgi:hypothetical protein